MSKKFRSQASSARAASNLTGGFGFASSFQTSNSPLSYVAEQPDLSRITVPNVVVAFKNLGKKDSTTKAKALDELLDYNGEFGQETLQAWVDIYPRTSIDNSRRVRQLAHTLQGKLTVAAGKRIAPLMPKIVGPWLAGTFDNDKSVSRSAQEALDKSFTTPEKRTALWTLYKSPLVEYVEDAVTKQTTATLSDERTTSTDDAQAKYVRVVGTGISMLAQLLKSNAKDNTLTKMFSEKKIWEFVYHDDSYLRRSICDLATNACEKHADMLDWSILSSCFLSKGLHSSQVGSSRQYTTALLQLTKRRPQLWTSDYNAKTAVSKRFIQFLKQGSHNGPEDVWSNIAVLIRTIPEEVWLTENRLDCATQLAEALRIGASQPSERVNAATAWATYVQTCLWVMGKLDEEKANFASSYLTPIVAFYVTRQGERQWNVGPKAVLICKGILLGLVKQSGLPVFETVWSELVESTANEMRLSLPETSKDFRLSQDNVIDQAKRLFNVKLEISKSDVASSISTCLEQSDQKLLTAAIQLLKTRNAKPYGAAGIIELIVGQPEFDKNNSAIQTFVEDDIPYLINSPSSEKLASIALMCGHYGMLERLFQSRNDYTDNALSYILMRTKAEHISDPVRQALSGFKLDSSSDRKILQAVMRNSVLNDLHSIICRSIQQSLTTTASLESQTSALLYLDELLSSTAGVVISDENRSMLLPDLLLLSDAQSELSGQANLLVASINDKARDGSGSAPIIRQQLKGEGAPLTIARLVDLANGIVEADNETLNAIMPTSDAWQKALSPHFLPSRPYSLAVTSPLQGLVFSIKASTGLLDRPIEYDGEGFSLAMRLLLYTTNMLSDPDVAAKFNGEILRATYQFYPIALQLLNEKLTVEDANQIWTTTTAEDLQDATDALNDGNRIVQSWLGIDDFSKLWLGAAHDMQGNDIATLMTALAWTNTTSQYVDKYGPAALLQEYDQQVRTLHKVIYIVQSAVLSAVLRDTISSSAQTKRILNELVVNATEAKRGDITPIIILNILLNGETDVLETMPTQRVVFLLKNLVELLDDIETQGMQFEVMKLLTTILPQVQDIYGEHWDQIIGEMVKLWAGGTDLLRIYASVKLHARLRSLLRGEDVNEDLQDAWNSAKADLDQGLLNCLRELSHGELQTDQPRTITAEIIRRQLHDVRLSSEEDVFTLLSSPVQAIQSAAYELLHRAIPQQQEQLSVELLLEKREVKLPEQLTLLLADIQDDNRKYMLIWILIFDHFSNASYKLQEAYTADLKAGGSLDAMLDFICGVIMITDGRPIDASKFDILSFEIDRAESAEKEMQWLAVHSFYRSLLCVPSLTKDWFISQKNRIKSPLEAWTQKHISPLIVAASLSTVNDWALSLSQDNDDKPLVIKPSPRGSELTATIAVDPESPPISLAISLPGSYPLESPVVTSRSRVGVSEKNWQSWLRTIQIIVFSTGSIIEGLIAFRRNVQGALKGQTECAICYSIIGTDMQTPNKKCGTCKNMFHGSCLFRWFKSSNSSSCPLCRNNFNYA